MNLDSEGQDDHDRWFDALLAQLRRRHVPRRSGRWKRTMAEATRLDVRQSGEVSEMMRDAEPATEDDVPWRFPVRTPLEDHR